MGIFRFVFGLLLLLIFVMYSVQNLTPVPIGYYNHLFDLKTVHVPLIVVIFFSMISGFFVAWLVGLIKIQKLKSTLRKQKKEIKELTKDLRKKDEEIASLTESAPSDS